MCFSFPQSTTRLNKHVTYNKHANKLKSLNTKEPTYSSSQAYHATHLHIKLYRVQVGTFTTGVS